MRKLSIEELEVLFGLVLKSLKEDNVSEIEISDDYYRLIPTSEWDKHSDVIYTGSLFDDVDSLKLHFEKKRRIFTYVDFDRLASILRYASEKLNPVDG